MPAVHLDSVTFSYTSALEVISETSLSLGAGWHGVVGENGSGKTTLLELVVGTLMPNSGRVIRDPGDAVVAWCPQIVDLGDAEHDGAWRRRVGALADSWDSADASLRGRLQLDPAQLERWSTLSPGERRRWQLAACLAARPDILCVDEPTNHLDVDSERLLVDELERFGGVGVIVSHHRLLLDRLTSSTLRVAHGSVRTWSASYSTAAESWAAADAELAEGRDRLRRERARVGLRLENRRRSLREIGARDQARRRKAGPSDHDARSLAVKNRQASAARRQGRAAGVDSDRLVSLDESLAQAVVPRSRGGAIAIEAAQARMPTLLSFRGPLRIGGCTLIDDLTVEVGRTTRMRVAGPNGVGKTTLLRALVANGPAPEDRILWLPQELSPEERRELVIRLGKMRRQDLGSVMAIAARLGVEPERTLDSDRPSPGEARKLALADGLGRGAWVVVLDEPTNHLDLPSIERLEKALVDYEGAIVVVTHDDRFASAVTTEELILVDPT